MAMQDVSTTVKPVVSIISIDFPSFHLGATLRMVQQALRTFAQELHVDVFDALQ
jgi:hypothetical protein